MFHGGDGDDYLGALAGDDVIYGGDGNDTFAGGEGNDYLVADDGKRDELYCGKGWDQYLADTIDYVDSSPGRECEEGTLVYTGGPPLILLAGAALLLLSSSGLLVMSRYVIRRGS